MSSPAQGASQGPSTPAEQPAGKQLKRPTSLGRKSSSWINRLHRHHDRKHNRSDNDVERPLLANDHPNEEDEEAQIHPTPPSTGSDRLHRFLSATNHHSRKAYNASRDAIARNARPILVACLLALITLLLSILIGLFFHHKDDKKLFTCQTAACVHAASGILYNLDPNYAQLDACNQFDQMVCGGWRQRHDLRPDQGDMFTGTIMAENAKTILRHILEQSSLISLSSPADQDNFQKLKDDYDSCMDEQALQKLGIKPLQGIVNQIKTSFPATVDRKGQRAFPKLENNPEKGVTFDGANQLTDALLFLMKLDITAFLAFDVTVSKAGFSTPTAILPSKIGQIYSIEETANLLFVRLMTATLIDRF
jgi:Peptidase family M13